MLSRIWYLTVVGLGNWRLHKLTIIFGLSYSVLYCFRWGYDFRDTLGMHPAYYILEA